MPMTNIYISTWRFPSDVALADRVFHKPAPIDILLGAEIFFEILKSERYDCKGLPVLQNTKLGYLLSGKLHHSYVKDYKRPCHSLFVQTDSLHHMMERFWSIEQMNNKILTKEERDCEKHFELNTKILETGQYEVRLPLSDSAEKLGDSYDTAKAKLLTLERRLLKQPQLRKDYSDFLEEYVQLEHMTPLCEAELKKESPNFYMPHHCVLKETSFTTKLRVVFNGSEKSNTGMSLNDILMIGPKVQDDLFDIVQRFRLHRIVMSADIAKMYRQVWVHPDWHRLQHELPIVNCIQIDRLIISKEELDRIELRGFSYASEVVYGACIYLRSIDVERKITTRLICSKSRVAPLKRPSLPRSELCATMLLADMYQASLKALKLSFNNTKFWTDSMIVLAWLRSPAVRWKTFVANRVSHIQETTNIEDWNHVNSKDNPADLVSRGVEANLLRDLSLWWNGPNWLQQAEPSWPKGEEITDVSEERKRVNPTPIVSLLTQSSQEEVFTKFSSWTKLQRVAAYCLRFIHNCCHKTARFHGTLSQAELNEVTLLCVKQAQNEHFKKEKADLTEKGSLSRKSSLLSLNPFLDGNQLLRVGGRLDNADLMFDQQHPLILPKGHHITTLIIVDTHKKNMHTSGQLLLSLIRQSFGFQMLEMF
jgi:hypothetical protein